MAKFVLIVVFVVVLGVLAPSTAGAEVTITTPSGQTVTGITASTEDNGGTSPWLILVAGLGAFIVVAGYARAKRGSW